MPQRQRKISAMDMPLKSLQVFEIPQPPSRHSSSSSMILPMIIVPSKFRYIAALGFNCRIGSNIKIMSPSEEKKCPDDLDSHSKDSISEGSVSSEESGT